MSRATLRRSNSTAIGPLSTLLVRKLTHAPTQQNEKWESIAVVPVDPEHPGGNDYFVFSLSDNDFITQNGYLEFGQFQYADSSGFNLDNQALVFKVTLPS